MTFIICLFAFAGLCAVLLALPRSRLRDSLAGAFGWGSAAVSGSKAPLLFSPIDFWPEFLGGFVDDLGYAVLSVMFGLLAYLCLGLRQKHLRAVRPEAPQLSLPFHGAGPLTIKEKRNG